MPRECHYRAFGLVLFLAACSSAHERTPSEIVVELDAEPTVRAEARSLEVKIEGGNGLDELGTRVTRFDQVIKPVNFPQRVAITPLEQDDRRVFVLSATVLDAYKMPVASARIISGYVPGEVRYARLLIEDACVGIECSALETCTQQVCGDATVTAPELSRNENNPTPSTEVAHAVVTVPPPGASPSQPTPDAGPPGSSTMTDTAHGSGGLPSDAGASALGAAGNAGPSNPATPPAGTGGASGQGTGGSGTGSGGTSGGSDAGATDAGSGSNPLAPVLPAITQTCPAFASGTITFMGLAGIEIVAGSMPATSTAPLLFYWHGTGSSSSEYQQVPAIRDGVVAEGGVLVSFQGTTGGDLLSGTSIFGAGDLSIVDQLAACAVRDHNVDPRRIYTTGCSGGGIFATSLATLRSSYIAAAAPNSGGWVISQSFEDNHSPALMTIHGAAGTDVVAVDFSTTSMTADQGFKTHGSFVIDCNTGQGHCSGFSLAPDVWAFFEAHPFGVGPDPWAAMLPANFSTLCTIQ